MEQKETEALLGQRRVDETLGHLEEGEALKMMMMRLRMGIHMDKAAVAPGYTHLTCAWVEQGTFWMYQALMDNPGRRVAVLNRLGLLGILECLNVQLEEGSHCYLDLQ